MSRAASLRLYALIALAYGAICWVTIHDSFPEAQAGPLAVKRAIATTSQRVKP